MEKIISEHNLILFGKTRTHASIMRKRFYDYDYHEDSIFSLLMVF